MQYLRLEKGLSANTLLAYASDLQFAAQWGRDKGWSPTTATDADLRTLVQQVAISGRSERTQSRLRSTLRSFYQYLALEGLVTSNPMDALRAPRLPQKLPVYLTTEEVDAMVSSIDRSLETGERNFSIVETLFGCGLRVSELVELRLRDVYFKEELVRVIGKGNKERLVPINDVAARAMKRYIEQVRIHQSPVKGSEDHVYLNRRGKKLSRQMVFLMLRGLATAAGISKTIGPHTLRHSFATSLVQNGADIRAVQELLGHESIVTTEIYSHLEQKHLRMAVEMFHPWAIQQRAKKKKG